MGALRSIRALLVGPLLTGLAASSLGCAALDYCPLVAPDFTITTPSSGRLTPSSVCVEPHVHEPLTLQTTRPSVAWLEPAGAWGDDRWRHGFSTDLTLSAGPGQVATLGGDNRVSMWEEASGHLLWTTDLGVVATYGVASSTGAVFVTDPIHRELVALDGATGAIRFRSRLPVRPTGLVMSADQRYVVDTGPLRAHFDAAQGTLLAPSLYRESDREQDAIHDRVLAFDAASGRVARATPRRDGPALPGAGRPLPFVHLEVFRTGDVEPLFSRLLFHLVPWDAEMRLRFDGGGEVLTFEVVEGARITHRAHWSLPAGDLLDSEAVSERVVPETGVAPRSRAPGFAAWKLTASADGRAAAWRDPRRVVWVARADQGAACALNTMPATYTGNDPEPESFALDAKGEAITLVTTSPSMHAVERWDARHRVPLDAFTADHVKAIALLSDRRAVFERTILRGANPSFRRDHLLVELGSPEKPVWLGAQVGEKEPRWTLDHALFNASATVAYATTSFQGTLSAWDLPGRTKLRDLSHAIAGTPWALSPDGRWLALEAGGLHPELWDVSVPREVAMPFPAKNPTAFAFSADSRTLALATYDGLVRLFSVPGGELLATADLNPRGDAALSLAFGPDVLWIGTARGVLFRVRLAGAWAAR